MHTAPGSQNGFDNSGRRGPIRWLEGDNVERTLRILEKITQNMADWIAEGHIKEETMYGIELLNEPAVRYFQYFQIALNLIDFALITFC